MGRNRVRRPQARAFLRWAGGKARIVRYLLHCLPDGEFGDYWEPFLGSGALFFALAPGRAHLSDSNSDLIACYQQVRDRPDVVSRYLRQHLANTSEPYYYEVRSRYNHSRLSKRRRSAAQAARFIYLNRTSFNGIFRVNRRGEYNVPYGFKEPPPAPDRQQLRAASAVLLNASMSDRSYDDLLRSRSPQPGDLVYLDPPYPPLTATANFTHYTVSRFSWRDHEKLSGLANDLARRRCMVMISNTDAPRVRHLYAGWNFCTLPVRRWVSADGSRHMVTDLVITNYLTTALREAPG